MRQRIGAVCKWAIAQGYRDDNPAGEAISAALPKNAVRQQHMRALPHADVRAALARVRSSGAYLGTMLAFEFLVLTAFRSGEVRNARWDEIDRAGAVWTIPAERMKAGREHRVPLSPRAARSPQRGGATVRRRRPRVPVANRAGAEPRPWRPCCAGFPSTAVPHGFRSSFRDCAAECSDAPRQVCELALAHVNNDRVEAAYRRTDLFDKRRSLMDDWSAYVGSAGSSRRFFAGAGSRAARAPGS